MTNISKRVPFVRATSHDIERQKLAVDIASTASERAEALYKLFRMVWRLPVNKDMRRLTKTYLWPNIREWRTTSPENIQSLRCYIITMENTFKHLKTG